MDTSEQPSIQKHCGVVTIIGRPSVGKSTFVNTVCGQKVSIVSPMPQTTRNAIRAIYNNDAGQILFLDTPGLHKSDKKFNEKLKSVALNSLDDADLILYLMDSTRPIGDEEEAIFSLLAEHHCAEKLFIALNKVDDKTSQLGVLKLFIRKIFPMLNMSTRLFEISARTRKNIPQLLNALIECLPIAEPLYPSEYYTDQEMDFRISEIIREKAIEHTKEEVPHALYVTLDELRLKPNGKELTVRALIFVEHESQKGILIGKNASRISAIKAESLKTLRTIFDYHISLSIQVRVDKDWRKNEKRLNELSH